MTPITLTLPSTQFSERHRVFLLVVIMLVGMLMVVALSRWLDQHKVEMATSENDERLYLNSEALKRLSLGFDGLVSDWYWMRSLQYVGRKIINRPKDRQLDNLGDLDLHLLAPLLDNATSLDPQFLQPYEYAAIVLPDIEANEAIRITRKGIAANPGSWQLRQYLAYIYWQQGDYKMAAQTYSEAARTPNAPQWLAAMEAQMLAQGGTRDTARKIYSRINVESDDPNIREMARRRLMQLQWFEDRDNIKQVLSEYSATNKRCPSSFREIADRLHLMKLRFDETGTPVDAANFPYQLNGCEVQLDRNSEVPIK